MLLSIVGAIIALLAQGRTQPPLPLDLQPKVGVSRMPVIPGKGLPSAPFPKNGFSRNVGAGVVASPPVDGQALERVAALPQPTPPARPNQLDPERLKPVSLRWRLVYNTVATSAGILQYGETALVLPGVDAVTADETCALSSGARWPCGMAARTAFRNYLKGRALNCHLPDAPPDNAIVAECLLSGQDPAAWLVENGWARAKTDGPFGELATRAKSASRGIFGLPPKGIEINEP